MDERSCSICKYSIPYKDGKDATLYWECRFNPPIAYFYPPREIMPALFEAVTYYPRMQRSDWCFRFVSSEPTIPIEPRCEICGEASVSRYDRFCQEHLRRWYQRDDLDLHTFIAAEKAKLQKPRYIMGNGEWIDTQEQGDLNPCGTCEGPDCEGCEKLPLVRQRHLNRECRGWNNRGKLG